MKDETTLKNESELRRLQAIWDEETLSDKHWEVEVVHRGHCMSSYCRVRRLGRGESKDGKAAAEAFEIVKNGRDPPEEVIVKMKGGQRLETHARDLNFGQSRHGNAIVMGSAMLGLVFLEIVTLMVAMGGFSATPDLSQWYFVGPVAGISALIASMMIISERSHVKSVTIECACPDDEVGNCHVGYVINSPVTSCIEMFDTMGANPESFKEAINDLKEVLSERRRFERGRVMYLETENKRLAKEAVNSGGQTDDTLLMTGDRAKRSSVDMKYVAGAIVLTAIVVACLMFAAQGA